MNVMKDRLTFIIMYYYLDQNIHLLPFINNPDSKSPFFFAKDKTIIIYYYLSSITNILLIIRIFPIP